MPRVTQTGRVEQENEQQALAFGAAGEAAGLERYFKALIRAAAALNRLAAR